MPGELTHPPARVVAQIIVNIGYGILGNGSSTAWQVYTGTEPNNPDDIITCYDFLGNQHGRTGIDGQRQEHHGVQVRVRSRTYPAGYSKIQQIGRYFDENILRSGVQIDGVRYNVLAITHSGIIRLGAEPTSKRQLFVINCQVSVREC